MTTKGSKAMSDFLAFGTLHDDLTAIASRVHQTAFDGPVAVWADERGAVFGSLPERAPDVPATWMAGTFASGAPMADIEADLRALLRDRATDSILAD